MYIYNTYIYIYTYMHVYIYDMFDVFDAVFFKECKAFSKGGMEKHAALFGWTIAALIHGWRLGVV